MPPLMEDEGSDVDALANGTPARTNPHFEAGTEVKGQLQDELADNIEEAEDRRSAQAEKRRNSLTPANSDGEEDDDDEEEDEDAYEVEKIIGHQWTGRGKKVLKYVVKWKGWPDDDNTLEPEENLLNSRDELAAYHHSIGGAPQPDEAKSVKKKKLSTKVPRGSVESAVEDSPAPPAKRQKRLKQDDSSLSDDLQEQPEFGSWKPSKPSWENDIKQIHTIERDPTTRDLYILMLFKNGKKSRVKCGTVRQRAPQKLLDFYEEHLNFSGNTSM